MCWPFTHNWVIKSAINHIWYPNGDAKKLPTKFETDIVLRCSKCGQLKLKIMKGKHAEQLVEDK